MRYFLYIFKLVVAYGPTFFTLTTKSTHQKVKCNTPSRMTKPHNPKRQIQTISPPGHRSLSEIQTHEALAIKETSNPPP